jgi:hypothetical protein
MAAENQSDRKKRMNRKITHRLKRRNIIKEKENEIDYEGDYGPNVEIIRI